MTASILLVVVGLAILLLGARFFVNGVAALAAAMGVPRLVIGMTLVAFGTSTPELVVNGLAAVRGSTDLAFGNIVGSCVVNVGFVLGLTAMIKPLRVEPSLITREIPMLWVAAAAFIVLGQDMVLNGEALNAWARIDGIVLLLFFCIFLYYTVRQTMSTPSGDTFLEEARDEAPRSKSGRGLWMEVLYLILGLGGVTIGASLTVDNAVELARGAGISEAVIGLTIISLGTTLPELATCVMAARRGEPDIALGNVVGSNLFNLLCIGGAVGTITPVSMPQGGQLDLLMMALLTALLLPIAIRSGRVVTRTEGAFLFTIYVGYLAWRLTHSVGAGA